VGSVAELIQGAVETDDNTYRFLMLVPRSQLPEAPWHEVCIMSAVVPLLPELQRCKFKFASASLIPSVVIQASLRICKSIQV
jgi:hypothetical protein